MLTLQLSINPTTLVSLQIDQLRSQLAQKDGQIEQLERSGAHKEEHIATVTAKEAAFIAKVEVIYPLLTAFHLLWMAENLRDFSILSSIFLSPACWKK